MTPEEQLMVEAAKRGLLPAPSAPQAPSIAKNIARKLALGVTGAGRAIVETAMMPFEASAAISRMAGMPSTKPGEITRAAINAPTQATQAALAPVRQYMPNLGPAEPQTTGDKLAYGAGRGAGAALSFAVPAAAVARAAAPASMTQGIAQTMAAQPITQVVSSGAGGAVTEATNNPWLGLATSLAVPVIGAAGRRAISPVTNVRNAEERRLADVLRNEGVPLRAGQETGSRGLRWLEATLDDLPFSGAQGARVREAQSTAYNRAVLGRAGIAAEHATPAIIDDAAHNLGQRFETLARQTNLQLDPQFRTELAAVVTNYGRKLPTQMRRIVQNYVQDLTTQGGRPLVAMRGEAYQTARTDLTKQAKALINSDPTSSRALYAIRNALDAAANRSMPAQLRGAWQEAQRDYRNFATIRDAMSRATQATAAGNIPPAQLATEARRSTTPGQFARGTGDLNDLARAGRVYLEQMPQSGTGPRSAMAQILTGGGLPTAGSGMGALIGGLPGAALGAAVGYGLPPAVAAFVNSPAGRAWLTNQIATQASPRLTPGLLGTLAAEQMSRPGMFQ